MEGSVVGSDDIAAAGHQEMTRTPICGETCRGESFPLLRRCRWSAHVDIFAVKWRETRMEDGGGEQLGGRWHRARMTSSTGRRRRSCRTTRCCGWGTSTAPPWKAARSPTPSPSTCSSTPGGSPRPPRTHAPQKRSPTPED